MLIFSHSFTVMAGACLRVVHIVLFSDHVFHTARHNTVSLLMNVQNDDDDDEFR